MKNPGRAVIVIFLLFVVLVANQVAASPGDHISQIIVQNTSNQGLVLDLQVPWQLIEFEQMTYSVSEYIHVTLPGCAMGSVPGKPALPMITEMIAVPFGVDMEIEVTPGKAHIHLLPNDVIPAVTQFFDSIEITDKESTSPFPERRLEIVEDPEVYHGNSSFPGFLAEITHEGVIRQQRVAGLSFYPLQYHPQSKVLTVYESLHVEIKFTGKIPSQRNVNEQESLAYEKVFKDLLLNYDESRNWRQPVEMEDFSEPFPVLEFDQSSSSTVPNPGWRIRLIEEGFYKLNYEKLLAADFPVESVDLSTIQIFHLGSEIAVKIEDVGGDGNFNPEDAVIFFAQSLDNKYSQENIYWLTHGLEKGLRVTTRNVNPDPENMDTPLSFTETKHLEENLSYLSLAPGDDSFERFMWTFLSDGTQREFPVVLPSIEASAPGYIKLALLGYNNILTQNPDHRAIIYVNEVQVADVVWDGRTWVNVNVPIPAGVINSVANSIEIENPSDGNFDAFYVDWAEITYQRLFIAENDLLDFSYHEISTPKFQISGFSDENIAIFDVTDPVMVERLVGFNLATNDSVTAIIFQDEISAPKRYWAASRANYLSPIAIEFDKPSNLKKASNGADYILITHKLFADHLSDLKNLRAAQGLRVFQVDIQDIYDEFNFGIRDAVAINQFLSYAYENWEGLAPSYVLLVGDGHYNPKNYNPSNLGFNRESFIPPYLAMVDPGIGETASDNRYVTIVGSDPLPDMMIGRLAVNSVPELSAFIDKILAYEGSLTDGDWRRQVLTLADNSDQGGAFSASSQNLLSCCLPDHYQAERVYLGITHSTIDSARDAFISGINSGKVLINYMGHGAYSQWGGFDDNSNLSGDLLSNSDISGLTNYGKYPVILAMTCYEGFFHHPHPLGSNYESLAEVITKADSKGAVASFSPTGVGLAAGHDHLNQGFFKAVFENNVETLGVAVTFAKMNLWATGSNLDLLDTYMLFGDPATNFARTLMAVNDAYQLGEDETLIITNAEEGILDNDINPQDASLSAVLVDDVSNGDLTFGREGAFTYTPNAGFHGSDNFTYKANDGLKDSNIATVTIQVIQDSNHVYLPLVFK